MEKREIAQQGMNERGHCFIIMPITTPEIYIEQYGGDIEHFRHILDHLVMPAVEKAGFKAVPPIAKGAELIQANIIRQLDAADLVLCDMSILNPNVFFELGIRTALNKRVCMIKDDMTESIPFDTSIVNCYTYKASSIHVWEVEGQVAALSKHISESFDNNTDNQMWRYFGLNAAAELKKNVSVGNQEIWELIRMDIKSIKSQLETGPQFRFSIPEFPSDRRRVLEERLARLCFRRKSSMKKAFYGRGERVFLRMRTPWTRDFEREAKEIAAENGFSLEITLPDGSRLVNANDKNQ